MIMYIELFINPWEGVNFPERITTQDSQIVVDAYENGCVKLVLNEEITVSGHIKAVQELVGMHREVSRNRPDPPRIQFNLDENDLDILKPIGCLIWDSVFKKPEPVMDLTGWCQSEASDNYVYLPNNLRKTGEDMEEYMANAHYTEVLTNAYRAMCAEEQISPDAILQNGSKISCAQVMPHQGTQHTILGEKSARLANSRLDDFDDSQYAASFIREILNLPPSQYEDEPIRRRVLSKVECILMGRTSHTYNQRFIQRFLAGNLGDTMESVVSVLKSMVTDGFVLEDSIKEFEIRMARAGVSITTSGMAKLYEACCGNS